jgi:nucleotide-binding universal stress UspA family protein
MLAWRFKEGLEEENCCSSGAGNGRRARWPEEAAAVRFGGPRDFAARLGYPGGRANPKDWENMAFRTILGVIDPDRGDDDLELAAGLCGQAGAHLCVLLLSLAPPPAVGRFGEAVVSAWLSERQGRLDRLEERRRAILSDLSDRGLSAEVIVEYSEEAWVEEAIGRRARYADLTLIGPGQMSPGPLKDEVVEGALFDSGKPLLAVPAGARPTLKPRRVQLAWDGRIEAARAARESLGLLAEAEDVRLVTVDPEEDQGADPAAAAAAWLARHGIDVSVDRLASGGLSVAETLRRHALEKSADLLVMGGYGHSRLRERIFGGVTRSMLENPPLPIFMAR